MNHGCKEGCERYLVNKERLEQIVQLNPLVSEQKRSSAGEEITYCCIKTEAMLCEKLVIMSYQNRNQCQNRKYVVYKKMFFRTDTFKLQKETL